MSDLLKETQKALEYLYEENRRKTYKKWVFSDRETCNADKMAEAGFIYAGNKAEPDAVKCFLCNKSLDGWDPTDSPWEEHLKHSPKCSFARLQRNQDCLTIEQFLGIKNELVKNEISSYYDQKANRLEEEFERFEQEIMSEIEKKQ